MSNKTAEKKGQKGQKNKARNAAAEPVAVEPKGEDVAGATATEARAATETTQAKRGKKNATESVIDPSNVESGRTWLSEFYEMSAAHPPIKGYDQHWNKEGFIHTGPATRLPNRGAANMVTLIGDILAKRELGGDTEARAYLDYCIAFLTSHRQALQDAREAEILAQADAIKAKKTA